MRSTCLAGAVVSVAVLDCVLASKSTHLHCAFVPTSQCKAKTSRSLQMCENPTLQSVRGEAAVRACIEKIQDCDSTIRAFVDVRPEQAMQQLAEGSAEGRLLGCMPVGVKAIFDVAGMESNWGTPVHAGRVPDKDSAVVKMLKDAGAIIIGTTVSTEYANVAAGPTRNPHDLSRTPGGSSSGSAAAVAAGMVPLAVGTQTVGSIIRPATYCGVFGLKPTHGAISLDGAMPLAPPLDHAGVIAADLDILYAGFRALVPEGHERSLPVCSQPRDGGEQRHALSLVHMTGPWPERVSEASHEALRRALAAASRAGIEVRHAQAPASLATMDADWTVVLKYRLGLHHFEDRQRAGGLMSSKLKELIDDGRRLSAADEDRALRRLAEHRRALQGAAGQGGVFLTAATDDVAPLASEEGTGPPTLQGIWSSTGMPALALPCGLNEEGLPIGVQLSAHPGGEEELFALARQLCRHLPSSRLPSSHVYALDKPQ